jgi:hypothetical protein
MLEEIWILYGTSDKSDRNRYPEHFCEVFDLLLYACNAIMSTIPDTHGSE